MTDQQPPPVGDSVDGDSIAVGSISGAQAVAIGRGAQAIVNITELSKSATLEQRNRGLFLQKIQQFWIDEVFTRSVKSAEYILLDKETRFDMIADSMDALRESTGQQRQEQVFRGTELREIFEEMGRSLLILGDPGSGKTTSFLELTDSYIALAARDMGQPMPVILNLTSWRPPQALDQWIITELHGIYGVPPTTAAVWVEEGSLLLMLDGLDEITSDNRAACVDAINAFRAQYSFAPIAISSCEPDISAVPQRLNLTAAVRIDPLNDSQIERYLGDKYLPLRQAIAEQYDLAEMATRPLMLNLMMTLADEGHLDELLAVDSGDQRRAYILNSTRRKLDRATDSAGEVSSQHLNQWLGWIAKEMLENGQSVFLLERINPIWLDPPERRFYSVLVLIFFCTVYTIFLEQDLLAGAIGGVVLGAIFLYFSLRGRIRPVESLGWSLASLKARFWRNLWRGALLGIGVVDGLILLDAGLDWETLLGGVLVGAFFGIVLGLALAGMRSEQVSSTSVPNQGIRRSGRYALVTALVFTVIGTGLMIVLNGFSDLANSLGIGLAVGVMLGMIYGGAAWIQHFIVRLFLNGRGDLPLWVVSSLDFAVEQGTLRRVGGGYIFCHRSLHEQYASHYATAERERPRLALRRNGRKPAVTPVDTRLSPVQPGTVPAPIPFAASIKAAAGEISPYGTRLAIHAFELPGGEDLLLEVRKRASNRALDAAIVVSCTGDLTAVALRYPGVEGVFHLDGDHEIMSVRGTLDADGQGDLRVVVAASDGSLHGGFLAEGCRIGASAQLFLGELSETKFHHALDKATGRQTVDIS